MLKLLWLIPALPLASSLLLILTQGRLPRAAVAALGVGSVGLAALIAFAIAAGFDMGTTYSQHLWQWFAIGSLQPGFSFYLDGLSLVMLLVVTGVGFLIHLYASAYMHPDPDYSRFFASMNLFLAAMLVLVLADNLLLLYLGWEGVGLCSYLLIGFWYQDPANGAAARKAFVITRVGDTAMAIGLFLLVREFGTLDIQQVLSAAPERWPDGSTLATACALLLLGGAVGKSAQLPLQNWLPDAMAGPTPVSALIHAATMVTAGVYLIARTHDLFLLAPAAQTLVAVVGVLTLLLAGYSALAQTDIKRILAYSTISQIGYMFLALGVGAWSAGIFHLVTHAFFKALLFLSAGSLILALHHQQDIRAMGGLYRRTPLLFGCFLVGSACLAALPLTSGFFSKEPILAQAWESSALLWLGALLGAGLTALYSFRLMFVVFFGPLQTPPQPLDMPPTIKARMPAVLLVLALLSLFGGALSLPLDGVLPATEAHPPMLVEAVGIGVPLLGVYLAYHFYLARPERLTQLLKFRGSRRLQILAQSGGGFDWLYDRFLRTPFIWLAKTNRDDAADLISRGTAGLSRYSHQLLAETQNGQLRWYASLMGLGLAFLIGMGVLT
ncbi:NADH-quinone oxidoreductase subunit L [Motiliproteus sp. SC1-56]|uniref:NADH-quinone oxidoreductase subunit L n=1 Tax=Motiliproteus sp. SC1-56 TaxID=2799565 RepID=UPI001F5DA19A|nr:NADH-quinone oxidoreductase subunit L [Motiliproteus sp. SC1-56]